MSDYKRTFICIMDSHTYVKIMSSDVYPDTFFVIEPGTFFRALSEDVDFLDAETDSTIGFYIPEIGIINITMNIINTDHRKRLGLFRDNVAPDFYIVLKGLCRYKPKFAAQLFRIVWNEIRLMQTGSSAGRFFRFTPTQGNAQDDINILALSNDVIGRIQYLVALFQEQERGVGLRALNIGTEGKPSTSRTYTEDQPSTSSSQPSESSKSGNNPAGCRDFDSAALRCFPPNMISTMDRASGLNTREFASPECQNSGFGNEVNALRNERTPENRIITSHCYAHLHECNKIKIFLKKFETYPGNIVKLKVLKTFTTVEANMNLILNHICNNIHDLTKEVSNSTERLTDEQIWARKLFGIDCGDINQTNGIAGKLVEEALTLELEPETPIPEQLVENPWAMTPPPAIAETSLAAFPITDTVTTGDRPGTDASISAAFPISTDVSTDRSQSDVSSAASVPIAITENLNIADKLLDEAILTASLNNINSPATVDDWIETYLATVFPSSETPANADGPQSEATFSQAVSNNIEPSTTADKPHTKTSLSTELPVIEVIETPNSADDTQSRASLAASSPLIENPIIQHRPQTEATLTDTLSLNEIPSTPAEEYHIKTTSPIIENHILCAERSETNYIKLAEDPTVRSSLAIRDMMADPFVSPSQNDVISIAELVTSPTVPTSAPRVFGESANLYEVTGLGSSPENSMQSASNPGPSSAAVTFEHHKRKWNEEWTEEKNNKRGNVLHNFSVVNNVAIIRNNIATLNRMKKKARNH